MTSIDTLPAAPPAVGSRDWHSYARVVTALLEAEASYQRDVADRAATEAAIEGASATRLESVRKELTGLLNEVVNKRDQTVAAVLEHADLQAVIARVREQQRDDEVAAPPLHLRSDSDYDTGPLAHAAEQYGYACHEAVSQAAALARATEAAAQAQRAGAELRRRLEDEDTRLLRERTEEQERIRLAEQEEQARAAGQRDEAKRGLVRDGFLLPVVFGAAAAAFGWLYYVYPEPPGPMSAGLWTVTFASVVAILVSAVSSFLLGEAQRRRRKRRTYAAYSTAPKAVTRTRGGGWAFAITYVLGLTMYAPNLLTPSGDGLWATTQWWVSLAAVLLGAGAGVVLLRAIVDVLRQPVVGGSPRRTTTRGSQQ